MVLPCGHPRAGLLHTLLEIAETQANNTHLYVAGHAYLYELIAAFFSVSLTLPAQLVSHKPEDWCVPGRLITGVVTMLILTRRVSESLKLGDEITITVLGVKGNQVRIGVDAPREVAVHREEIYLRIKNGDETTKLHG